tara:strand:- start:840 stop:3182 length:2343 start_codon:yes stop_codon:yes gene_type:complete
MSEQFILFDENGTKYTFAKFPQDLVDAGLLFTSDPTKTTDMLETTENKTFDEIISEIEFGPSISADATSYEIDKINAELGIADTAFGSALNRAENRIEKGLYTEDEYNALVKSIGTAWIEMMNADKSVAARLGSFVNLAATAAGVTAKAVGVAMEEVFGAGLNTLYDIVEPDVGGAADAFIDAALGKSGENVFSDWWIDKYGTYRYDAFTNSMVDISTGETIATIGKAKGDKETENKNTDAVDATDTTDTTPVVTTESEKAPTAPTGQAYNAIGQKGPRGQSNEGYEYKFDNPPGRGLNPGVTNIGDPDPEPLEKSQDIDKYTVTIYKDGQSKTVDFRAVQSFLDDGWSTTKPEEEVVVEDEEVIDDDTGTGQLVSDQLNEFNNIPKNAVLIDAGGELFLGYEVPGAYGQLYNGNPIYMLYEVLSNDVFEAGILTQGASPQVNVSLGSKQDLNQYGIVVGGTDELTDDVEHPFIRFVENFEAGKRVNPWLADTEINPNTGVTYQQEAIEFLAEQALEQFTPEQTQVRYEGSDWYQKSTTAQKTWLTTLLTQPAQAEQDIQDKQIEVKIAMEANGIASPPDALVNWVADKAVTGMWTQVYTDQQIALLADPYKPGTRDTGMVNFIEGVGVGTLDRLSVGEKTVRDLYRRYLGPSLGSASDTEIAEKAGLLRSDPDAEEQLKAYLEQQRLAMFGNYTNPTLTYNDIVQPYKNLVNQVWGQEVDETQDWFIKMVQDNDIEKAYTTLREKGMEQGIERVQDQALNDLQRSIGQGQIAPQLGANT